MPKIIGTQKLVEHVSRKTRAQIGDVRGVLKRNETGFYLSPNPASSDIVYRIRDGDEIRLTYATSQKRAEAFIVSLKTH